MPGDDASLTAGGFYRTYGTGTGSSFTRSSGAYEALKAQEEEEACGGLSCSQAAPRQGANMGSILRRVFGGTCVLLLFAVGVSMVNNRTALSTGAGGSLGAGKASVSSKITMSKEVREYDVSRFRDAGSDR